MSLLPSLSLGPGRFSTNNSREDSYTTTMVGISRSKFRWAVMAQVGHSVVASPEAPMRTAVEAERSKPASPVQACWVTDISFAGMLLGLFCGCTPYISWPLPSEVALFFSNKSTNIYLGASLLLPSFALVLASPRPFSYPSAFSTTVLVRPEHLPALLRLWAFLSLF